MGQIAKEYAGAMRHIDHIMTGLWAMERAFLLTVAVCLLLAPVTAWAADRPLKGVALVIGETNYVRLPVLTNPDKDVRDIDHTLDDLGFDVSRALDANTNQLRGKIDSFLDDAKGADVALVYYAGHGIEAGGADYIMGTDANIGDPPSASATLISIDDMLAKLQKTVPITIVLLDACRTNPFTGQQTLELAGATAPLPIGATGLEAVRGPTAVVDVSTKSASLGVVVGFSASPGQSALDGAPGSNSPYAAALLQHLGASGYSFGDVMTLVSQEVYVDTGARQLPWTSSSLSRVLYFGRSGDPLDRDDAAILDGRRKLLLDIAAVPEQSKTFVEAVASQENLKLADLYSMLEVINVGKATPSAAEQDRLLSVAKRVRETLDDPLLAAPPADPQLARLDALANKAIAAGAFELALQYRQQEATRAAAIEKGLDGQQEQIDATRKELAGVYARVAEAAMYNLDTSAEANAYRRAAKQSDHFDRTLSLKFRIRAADAAFDNGAENPTGYATAVALYRDILKDVPETQPALWAELQLKLGWALNQNGNQTNDQTTRDATVDAANAALTVFTEAGDYEDWNSAQRLLGGALSDSGHDQAARSALTILLDATPRDKRPLDWAQDEAVYAQLLLNDGTWRTRNFQDLSDAVVAFDAAATEFETVHSLEFAATLSSKGIAQVQVGLREQDQQEMTQGIATGRQALNLIDTKERVLRARVAKDLGEDMVAVGTQLKDAETTGDGLSLTAQAEKVLTEELDQSTWARMRQSDGIALLFLGNLSRDTKQLEAAAVAADDAYRAFSEIGPDSEAFNSRIVKSRALAAIKDIDGRR